MSRDIESASRVMALLFRSECWCEKSDNLRSNTGDTEKFVSVGHWQYSVKACRTIQQDRLNNAFVQ